MANQYHSVAVDKFTFSLITLNVAKFGGKKYEVMRLGQLVLSLLTPEELAEILERTKQPE